MICGHKNPVADCPICARCRTDAKFAAYARTVPDPRRKGEAKAVHVRRTTLCIHLGPMVERSSSCKGLCWHACEQGVNKGRVRPGDECQRCTKYDADGPEEPPAIKGGIVVPMPPALDLKPTKPRAVVTVVVGDEAERCFAVSGPLMRAYAERLDADFVVLRWPGVAEWPMSSKFAIARTLDHYERIAYVDADVLLRPGCVDLFRMCGEDEFGGFDELPYSRLHPSYGQEKRYQNFRREMGFRAVANLPWYMNAGVMVVPKSHRGIMLPPSGPIRPNHASEQDHTNAMLLDSGMPYRLLDRRCNWQNWTDFECKSAPDDAILHYSGGGEQRKRRVQAMAERAAK